MRIIKRKTGTFFYCTAINEKSKLFFEFFFLKIEFFLQKV